MAVRFIVDSAADVLPEECARLGVTHVPLKVIFGEEEFDDGVDLSHRAFYEKLVESDRLPTTSQVTPAAFLEALEPIMENGDEAVILTLSSRLSGTCQSARIAAAEYGQRVFVVDTLSVSLGERLLLLMGLRFRDQGLTAGQIAERLEEEKKKIRLMALVDTLEYLKRGGRISAATALAGSLLSIKPVIALQDGAVEVVGKARGSKQGNNLLRQLVQSCGGIDFEKPFCLAYSGLSDAMMNKYIIDSAELLRGHEQDMLLATVGCAIGTHAGPGAVAVAFFQNS